MIYRGELTIMDSQELKIESTFLRIGISKWKVLLKTILYFNFSLMIGSLTTPRWVKQGDRNTLWRGSLTRCGGCSGEWEDKYYYEIYEISKDNYVLGCEETFEALYVAGFLYLTFEVLALVVYVFLIVVQSGFIVKVASDKCIGKVIFSIFLLHTIAVILYFTISKIKLLRDCSRASDYFTSYNVCANQGPTIALVSEILCLISVILNHFIKRKLTQVHSEQSTSRMENGIFTTG